MMCESDEFNLFLRGPEDYEQSCASLSNVTVRHTRSFYESVFSEYHRSDLTLEMIEQITVYEKLIKSSMNSIKSFRKLAKNVTGIMSNFIESVDLIQDKLVEIEESYISGMREDEENILNKERTETQAHVYSALIQWAKLEILDLEAMLEAIAEKQTLDNSKSKFDARLLKLQKKFTKIQQGKSKLTNLTQFLQIKSRESTISELETEIHELENEIFDTEYVQRVVTVRLSEVEIPRFKLSRVERFSEVMESYSSGGIDCLGSVIDM